MTPPSPTDGLQFREMTLSDLGVAALLGDPTVMRSHGAPKTRAEAP